jgi:hypothetical protein
MWIGEQHFFRSRPRWDSLPTDKHAFSRHANSTEKPRMAGNVTTGDNLGSPLTLEFCILLQDTTQMMEVSRVAIKLPPKRLAKFPPNIYYNAIHTVVLLFLFLYLLLNLLLSKLHQHRC